MSKWGQDGDAWCPENDMAWQKEQAYIHGNRRCSECDCKAGGSDCNWISQPTVKKTLTAKEAMDITKVRYKQTLDYLADK